MVAYVSMAFGNPYGDAWNIDEVLQACDLIAECGVMADLAGGYRWSGHRRADRRGAFAGDRRNSRTLKSECICMRGQRKRRNGFALHFKPVADDSTRRSAALAVVRLRRMCWSAIFPPKILMAELRECGASLPAFGSLDALIAASNEISSRFGSVVCNEELAIAGEE